jgi:hypothetical protein
MQRGMWIMQLHGMVVIRKQSRKTNTYQVWRRMKALEMMSEPVLNAKPNALITCAPGSSYTHVMAH